MDISINVPSKTFLMGEYLALVGGPTLLLNTEPFFRLHVTDCHDCLRHHNLAVHGPVAKLLKAKANLLKDLRLEFFDPHQEQGGLGASSAQFLALYALLQHLKATTRELARVTRSLSSIYLQKRFGNT